MELLDAHSAGVQAKHYVLKEPKHDVALAKHLVEAVPRETVRMPTLEEAGQHFWDDRLLRLAGRKVGVTSEGLCDTDDEVLQLATDYPTPHGALLK